MIQNKQTLTLALTLLVTCAYAQEPVDLSRFVYDARIALMCTSAEKDSSSENQSACAEFVANIELMMQLGDELHEKTVTIMNNSGLSRKTRGLKLGELWVKELAPKLKGNYHNKKVLDYERESTKSLKKAHMRIGNIYRRVLLMHMSSGPAMYHELMSYDRELSSYNNKE